MEHVLTLLARRGLCTQYSTIEWGTRWDNYLHVYDPKIHWFRCVQRNRSPLSTFALTYEAAVWGHAPSM